MRGLHSGILKLKDLLTDITMDNDDLLTSPNQCSNFREFFLIFNKQWYKQIHGLPMGGCLSINISVIMMNYIVTKALEFSNIQPKLIVKYVNDLL